MPPEPERTGQGHRGTEAQQHHAVAGVVARIDRRRKRVDHLTCYCEAVPGFLALAEPLLLLVITILFALSALLARLPYWGGFAAVIALVVAIAAGYLHLVARLVDPPVPGMLNTLVLCALLTIALLIYLRLLTKAHSPALAEARRAAKPGRCWSARWRHAMSTGRLV